MIKGKLKRKEEGRKGEKRMKRWERKGKVKKRKERGSKEFTSLEIGDLLNIRRENILFGNTWK